MAILLVVVFFSLMLSASTILNTRAETTVWRFNDASNYTYDNTKIEITVSAATQTTSYATGSSAALKISPSGTGASNWYDTAPSSPPTARVSHSAVWNGTNDEFYIFGGTTASVGANNDLWRYIPASNTWTELSPGGDAIPTRNDHSAVWDGANNRMYVFGGYASGVGNRNDLWSYNPTANTWTNLNPSGGPAARYAHSAVWDSTNSKMYVFGGFTTVAKNDLWSYTPATNTWAQLSPTGTIPSARSGHSAVWNATNGKMYVFGGTVGGNELWTYTPATNAWAQITPTGGPPTGRAYHVAVWDATANKIYIFGGYLTKT